jgi:hypothetical protein
MVVVNPVGRRHQPQLEYTIEKKQKVRKSRCPKPKVILKETKDKAMVAEKLCGTGRKLTSFASTFTPIPKELTQGFGGTKMLAGVGGLFAIPEVVTAGKEVFTKKAPKEKVQAAGKLVLSSAAVVDAATEVAEGLHSVGAVSEHAVAWTTFVGHLLFPIQIIMLAIGIRKVYQDAKFCKQFEQTMKTADSRRSAVTEALRYLKAQDPKSLKGRLSLAKESKLDKKIARHMRDITEGNRLQKVLAIREGEKLVQELKERVRKKLTLDVLGLALKIVSVACAVALFFTPPGLVIAAITTVAAVIGLGLFFYKRHAMKQPLNLETA